MSPSALVLLKEVKTFTFSESAFLYLKKEWCYQLSTHPSRKYNS